MFSIPNVHAVHGDVGAAIVFNECLLRLMHLRKHQIAAGGDDENSHIAWKLAVFQQGILYRVVMLAQGGSNGWNEGNILSSILCARAMLETNAKLHYLDINLANHIDPLDLKSISELLDGQIFSTRNEEWLKDGAGVKATNILTMINKLDEAVKGTRSHYEFLSEWCHPNWAGQHFLFATSDTIKKVTTFSESKARHAKTLDAVFAALMMITGFEKLLSELDKTIANIASGSRVPQALG